MNAKEAGVSVAGTRLKDGGRWCSVVGEERAKRITARGRRRTVARFTGFARFTRLPGRSCKTGRKLAAPVFRDSRCSVFRFTGDRPKLPWPSFGPAPFQKCNVLRVAKCNFVLAGRRGNFERAAASALSDRPSLIAPFLPEISLVFRSLLPPSSGTRYSSVSVSCEKSDLRRFENLWEYKL